MIKKLMVVAIATTIGLNVGLVEKEDKALASTVKVNYQNKDVNIPNLKDKEVIKKILSGKLDINKVKLVDSRYYAKQYLGLSRTTDLRGKGKGIIGVKSNDGNLTSVHDIYGKNNQAEFVYTAKKGNASDKELKLKYIKIRFNNYSNNKISDKEIDKLYGKKYFIYEGSISKSVEYKNLYVDYKKKGGKFYVDSINYNLNQ